MGTVTMGFYDWLANRPFLFFDFRALWRSGLSARVPESQKIKIVVLASLVSNNVARDRVPTICHWL